MFVRRGSRRGSVARNDTFPEARGCSRAPHTCSKAPTSASRALAQEKRARFVTASRRQPRSTPYMPGFPKPATPAHRPGDAVFSRYAANIRIAWSRAPRGSRRPGPPPSPRARERPGGRRSEYRACRSRRRCAGLERASGAPCTGRWRRRSGPEPDATEARAARSRRPRPLLLAGRKSRLARSRR